jgi:ATP-dependent RNA helicase DeaD
MKTMVLDEADVMLKLGFKEDVDKILGKVRDVCTRGIQICLFSATIPSWVKDIAREHMKPDFRVVDLAQDLSNKTAKNVKHLAIDCPFHTRLDALSKVCKYIIFRSYPDCSELLWWHRKNHCLHFDEG